MTHRFFVPLLAAALWACVPVLAPAQTIGNWQMQNVANVTAPAAQIASREFHPQGWYNATVPGTVLTTLVNDGVYPEPLYGENMRRIPESLNKTSYWYRTTFAVPRVARERHIWLHFGGINYAAEIWVNGRQAGSMRGAFIRGDFDVTALVKPGHDATLAVLVAPQPHPGTPHEHTQALGLGKNGGETAIDGPTFLSTIGWDWLMAVRDRDTGIWQPVTMDTTGPVRVRNAFVTADLAESHASADLHVSATFDNLSDKPVSAVVTGVIQAQGANVSPVAFEKSVTLAPHERQEMQLDAAAFSQLHLLAPRLWWPNGYGPQNLYTLQLNVKADNASSDSAHLQFGIRKLAYAVPGSENLTISVNGVPIMVRGGNWGMDEAMKRSTRARLDAEFHMHAIANVNLIRNWVGQSTSPDFYDMADKYGMLLWDEFFQPNPNDGPNPADIPTYIANVTDKVLRYRSHPSIAVWCARNEGYPPPALNAQLKTLMGVLDPTVLYQANSADGRGVSSHGPYYWRAPLHFYALNESFKTETGSVSIPTIESIQGMMPKKDWETIDDDWAQHDMAAGAQRGDEYPHTLAERYGHIRNLADFVRKGQMANYEAFRAMYEGRNAQMFRATTGVITWMSAPAQPSFVWQLYHYDLDPNAALYAVRKAGESIHVQFNQATRAIEVVNNPPTALRGATVQLLVYDDAGKIAEQVSYPVAQVDASSTAKVAEINVPARITPVYFVKLNLLDANQHLLSTNLYWQHVADDQFDDLMQLPVARLNATATLATAGETTRITLTLHNGSSAVALLAHLQLHRKKSGKRVLPAFYSDNYLSLVPGESATIAIEAASADLAGEAPLVEVDGYNVEVAQVDGPVTIVNNGNAQPMHWPATDIVPDQIPGQR
jgi:mannosylglycoprotein endo-beta-mannosidase